MQRVTILFLSLLCLLTAAAAPKWSADVFMLNGTEHRGVPVAKLPEGWDKHIKTVVDNKKMSIPSDSISSVVLWRNDNPDDKCLIAWLPFGEFIMDDGSYKQTMNKKPANGLHSIPRAITWLCGLISQNLNRARAASRCRWAISRIGLKQRRLLIS